MILVLSTVPSQDVFGPIGDDSSSNLCYPLVNSQFSMETPIEIVDLSIEHGDLLSGNLT